MISLKDYAAKNHVSYEAVRQQVKRYAGDLEGHIIKVSRTQYLDDEAVAFLDEKRKRNPIIIQEASKEQAIQALQDENKALLLKVTELQDQLLREREFVKQLQGQLIEALQPQNAETEAASENEAQNGSESDEKPPVGTDTPTAVEGAEIENKTFWERFKAWIYG